MSCSKPTKSKFDYSEEKNLSSEKLQFIIGKSPKIWLFEVRLDLTASHYVMQCFTTTALRISNASPQKTKKNGLS